jgi:hypothetical protein
MWAVKTSDGREWFEDDDRLQVDGRSPWRELERICVECGYDITEAAIYCISKKIVVDADGYKLTVGRVVEQTFSDGGEHGNTTYMFVRREELDRWVWVVTDGVEWWEVIGEVGEERMPT